MLLPVIFLWLLLPTNAALPFTNGSIVVFRLGDGLTNLTTLTSRVTLLEIDPSNQVVVQNITMPANSFEAVAGISRFTAVGVSATPMGFLDRSFNKKYLVATAYGLDGNSIVNASSPRVIMRINASGTIDTLTAYAWVSDETRNVVTADGSGFWLALGPVGSAVVAHVPLGTGNGSQTATSLCNVSGGRVLGVYDEGQLYLGDTGKILKVGPSSLSSSLDQAVTTVIELTSTALPNQMVFLDRVSTVDGVDSLYFTDEANGGSGIFKYYKVGTLWIPAGTFPATPNNDLFRGLCGSVVGDHVVLYATRNDNEVVMIMDSAAYNANFSWSELTLYTQAGPYSLRGLAFSPSVSAECPYAYHQTGYVVSVCNGTSTAAGTTCFAVCDTVRSYVGIVNGTVKCPASTGGIYVGTFSGCVLETTNQPTPNPTRIPTQQPTVSNSSTQTPTTTPTFTPTYFPTNTPTITPTQNSTPTNAPTTITPTQNSTPTNTPTTITPTQNSTPTNSPTITPTQNSTPTNAPTKIPTQQPTAANSSTQTPTATSGNPTRSPTKPIIGGPPTQTPTTTPTVSPTYFPTQNSTPTTPTSIPTTTPSFIPTKAPTSTPTTKPTSAPTNMPTPLIPTRLPTSQPTTKIPSTQSPTTLFPTANPTQKPSTEIPSSFSPTTLTPTTINPSTHTSTMSPSTQHPTTLTPTVSPSTHIPTISPSQAPSTACGNATCRDYSTTRPTIVKAANGTTVIVQPDNVFNETGVVTVEVLEQNNNTASVIVRVLFLGLNGPQHVEGLISNVVIRIPLIPVIWDRIKVCLGEQIVDKTVEPECKYYDEITRTWISAGCHRTNLTSTEIECSCSHLTDFAAVLPKYNAIPVEAFRELTSENISAHPTGIIAIGVVVVVFSIVFALAVVRDRADAKETLKQSKQAKWGQNHADRISGKKRTLWKELKVNFQLRHTWAGLINRKTGTSFQSVDRVCVALTTMFASMSMSARFHGVDQSWVGRGEVIIFSVLACLLPAQVLTQLFVRTGPMGFYEEWEMTVGIRRPSKFRILNYRFPSGLRRVWMGLALLSTLGMILYILAIALQFDRTPKYYCLGNTAGNWVSDWVLSYVLTVFVVEPLKVCAVMIVSFCGQFALINLRTRQSGDGVEMFGAKSVE